jgi:GNAT superfamily N-acetyltransferase
MSVLPLNESRPASPGSPALKPGFEIKPLTPAALPALREPILSVAAQAFAAPPWNEKPADAIRLVDRMYEAATRPNFTALAAFDNGDMIAFTYGHTDDRLTAMSPTIAAPEAFEMIELAVAPTYQGQGIGRALHDALITLTPAPRLLLTHPEAPARRSYHRWGWTEVGEIPSATGHPVVMMRHG